MSGLPAAVGCTTYPWGNQWQPPNNAGNYAGQEMRAAGEWMQARLAKGHLLIGGFSDQHLFSAPVGSYPANIYGIHDLGGNVWEWCEDNKAARGSSWFGLPREFHASSKRVYFQHDFRAYNLGFRCVID